MGYAVDHPVFARFQARLARLEARAGGDKFWDELLGGLKGRVLDVGCGSGIGFQHYPLTVSEVVAIEPEPYLRAQADRAAKAAAAPIGVLDAVIDGIPAEDESFDAAVTGRVLCSVPDQASGLSEIRRVLRPGGELRFFEHVVATSPPLATAQRAADRVFWTRAMGGCHTSRDTLAQIERAGFEIVRLRRFSLPPSLFAAPQVIGIARRR